MTRLEKVIEEVKAAHTRVNRPWIFDESGNMREDVLVGDVLPLLEELKEYEVDISDDESKNLSMTKRQKVTIPTTGVQTSPTTY